MKKRPAINVLCAAILLLLVGSIAPQQSLASPYLGEVRWVSFNFAPKGWALCNGQVMQINQNLALFSLLGTTFGGDGVTYFLLPDMRSRAPIHVGGVFALGDKNGEESHVLSLGELATHTHDVKADPREGTDAGPTGNYPAKTSGGTTAYGSTPSVIMAPGTVVSTGGGQAHENMKPYTTLNCIIALQGIFPSPN